MKPYELGKKAYKNEINAPCHDAELMGLLKGMKNGESIPLMDEWKNGWNESHSKYLKAEFPEMYKS